MQQLEAKFSVTRTQNETRDILIGPMVAPFISALAMATAWRPADTHQEKSDKGKSAAQSN